MEPETPQSTLRVYRFQNLVLDPASLSVRTQRGARLHLRPKSFSTLLYVLEHRDRVVSKQELLQHVWDGVSVSDDVLVGCIRDIRHALGDAGGIIRTVPKAGYQFVATLTESDGNGRVLKTPTIRTRSRILWLALAAALVSAALVTWWFWPTRVTEVGWWRFDEAASKTVRDHSGFGNHGHIVGALHHTQEGPFRNAFEFRGDGYIAGDGPGTGFPTSSGSFTVTAWLTIPRTAPSHHSGAAVFHLGTAGPAPRSNAHLIVTDSGTVSFGWGYGYGLAVGGKNIADDQWHLVAGTYSRSERKLKVYIDGADDSALLLSQPSALGHGTPWMIGYFQTGGFPFVGALADLRVYNGLLTHPQIAALSGCAKPSISLPRGGRGYLVPLYRATVEPLRAPFNASGGFEYSGFGKGGAEFAVSDGTCSLASLAGAALPQDLRIGADLLLPEGTAAGPFFRAHRVRPGDPIEASGFGGFWVRMSAAGELAVHTLAHHEAASVPPLATGSSPVPVHPAEWHRLEAEARGPTLKVWVDGQPVRFRVREASTDSVSVAGVDVEEGAGIGVLAPPVPTEAVLVRSIRVKQPRN